MSRNPEYWDEVTFYTLVNDRKRTHPDERFGQRCFNVLFILDPELAEMIRGTNADPFYAETMTDPRFFRFEKELWG